MVPYILMLWSMSPECNELNEKDFSKYVYKKNIFLIYVTKLAKNMIRGIKKPKRKKHRNQSDFRKQKRNDIDFRE